VPYEVDVNEFWFKWALWLYKVYLT